MLPEAAVPGECRYACWEARTVADRHKRKRVVIADAVEETMGAKFSLYVQEQVDDTTRPDVRPISYEPTPPLRFDRAIQGPYCSGTPRVIPETYEPVDQGGRERPNRIA